MKRILLFAAAVLSFSACQKSESGVEPSPEKKLITLTATINLPETKVQPDNPDSATVTFHWEAGDSVFVYDTLPPKNKTVFRIVDSTIHGNTASFVGEPLETMTMVSYGLDFTSVVKGDTLRTVCIDGSFNPIAMGQISGNSFNLNTIMPVLRLKLKGTATVGKIRYGSKEVTNCSGEMVFNGGLPLDPSVDTVVYYTVPVIAKTGFTIRFYDENDTLLLTKTSSMNTYDKAGKIITMPSLTIDEAATDLSASGTANCYIVSKAGRYKFKATKGNSTDAISGIDSVVVLWESFGTSTAPAAGDLIKADVSYADDYVTFTTGSQFPTQNGNAVIAAKGNGNTILWSWHIWACSGYDADSTAQVYNNSAGTMMDRNLGATSATPGEVSALGLLYQWGRKDPFLSGNGISSNTQAASTLSTWPTAAAQDNSSDATVNLRSSISHPTTYITNSSYPYDWYCTAKANKNDSLWITADKKKTIYDPCPVGWCIPDGGDDGGIWKKANFPSGAKSHTFDNQKGMDFSECITPSATCWYPAAGSLARDGSLEDVGDQGEYWSRTPCDEYMYYLFFNKAGNVDPSDWDDRVEGKSVRCVQE